MHPPFNLLPFPLQGPVASSVATPRRRVALSDQCNTGCKTKDRGRETANVAATLIIRHLCVNSFCSSTYCLKELEE